MKILVCWPPHVPSYFNAGHHLAVFSIAAYMRGQGHQVDALDAGALNYTWKEFGDRLYGGKYELVALVNDFDVVEGIRRAAEYARALLPDSVIMTLGRLSYQIPSFFRQFPLDAIGCSGDHEAGVSEVVQWIARGRPDADDLAGIMMHGPRGWRDPVVAGRWLAASEWVFPDVHEIPYVHYDNLYLDDARKFCGVPQRRELVVPVARGCPIRCEYCDVSPMQGARERRVSVDEVVAYIRDSFAAMPFEYIAFYAPTFTLNRKWVLDLCQALRANGIAYPWKCATTVHHLDEALLEQMAASGCIRVSVGLETLEESAARQLPMVKRSPQSGFDAVNGWCSKYGIELNCFVIAGLPGTTIDGVERTIAMVEAAGARARPTVYTPYHELRGNMTEREVSQYNRQLFANLPPGGSREALGYLALIFGGSSYVTPVTARIPEAQSRVEQLG